MQSLDYNIEGSLFYRLHVIGLPHQMIKPLVGLFMRWVSLSGPEWTAKRFKSLKVDLIRERAGLPYTSTFIRKNKHGEFYGVIGSLFRWCKVSTKSKPSLKRFNRVLQALNCYTLLTTREATKSQLKKFLDGVDHVHDMALMELVRLNEATQELCKVYVPTANRIVKHGNNSLAESSFSPNKRAPRPHGLGSVPQDEDVLAEIHTLEYGSPYYEFGWRYNAIFQHVSAGIVGPATKPDPVVPDSKVYGGEVHFLQEPGYKLRAIASPYRLYQRALEPLANAIYDIVRLLPWDVTKDQSLAIPHVQQCLAQSKVVHSIDLSGATDYFPMEVQSTILREIFGDLMDISLFEEISRMPWKSKHGEITWKTGQPLGLRPSFASFTLAHGIVLYCLNGNRHDNMFFVVGDDVVILDDTLAHNYKLWLESNRCPFSPEKSLSSNTLAEFAGKVITQNAVIPNYKWRKTSNDNFLDLCRNLGPRSRCLLTKQQRKVFDFVKHLVCPFGLNFSYPGSNLTDMIIKTDRVLGKLERSSVRALVDLSRKLTRVTYKSSSHHGLRPEWVRERSAILDERIVLVFNQTVVKRWDLISLMNDLPEALGVSPRLPLEEHAPSRETTLQRYLGLLRLSK